MAWLESGAEVNHSPVDHGMPVAAFGVWIAWIVGSIALFVAGAIRAIPRGFMFVGTVWAVIGSGMFAAYVAEALKNGLK